MIRHSSETKIINLRAVYTVLNRAIRGESLTENDRFLLYRFRDKLTDSEKFELTTNQEFSRIQLKERKDEVEYKLNNREQIKLPLDFVLIPESDTNWVLKKGEDDYLTKLDTKLARRIAYDINVAVGIKASRNLT